jgi:F420H(2)-dependent quinone reductase
VRSLILHTTGRRSGRRRSVVLAYGRDGDAYVVMGSNFGRPRPPGWLVNLQADPQAEVNIGHKRLPVTAEIAMPGAPQYERLRPLARKATMGFFDRYEGTAPRPIPLVRLVPTPR